MFFQKQLMMRKVVYALTPIVLYSIYLYGWRSLAILIISVVAAIITEYIFVKRQNKKVTEAALVSACLYGLSLPPTLPLWMVPIGIILGIIVAKMSFGGFGRNIFNPAIASRLFIYLIFSAAMTASWVAPSPFGIDATSVATPLTMMRSGIDFTWFDPSLSLVEQVWFKLLFGIHGSSIGESAIFLIIIAAFYLCFTKTAYWQIMLACVIGYLVLAIPLAYFDLHSSSTSSLPVFQGLVSGSFLFVAVFMATDPVTAPKKLPSLWVYGIIIGLVTVIIRYFAQSYPEGVSFAVIIANMLAPLIDECFPKAKTAASAMLKKKK